MAPIGIIICVGALYALLRTKIIIDDNKIEVQTGDIFSIFRGKRTGNTNALLNWDEIEKLDSHYILYPESPIITLIPREGMQKEKIELIMFGMSIQLLADIITYLPKGTKVNLYSHLRRKLEGKQTWFFRSQDWVEVNADQIEINPCSYTKPQLITIALILTTLVISCFLFSWFFWK